MGNARSSSTLISVRDDDTGLQFLTPHTHTPPATTLAPHHLDVDRTPLSQPLHRCYAFLHGARR